MSPRWTLVLLALAAALGAWVYFGEIRGAERKKEAESAAARVFELDPATVTAVEVSLGDGKTARVARSAGSSDWKIESPIVYPADADTVERLLKALSKVQSSATISPAPADLAPFGLDDKRHSVRIFAGQGEPREVFVGGPAPVGGAKYFALASDPAKIFTVAAGDLYGLAPTLLELRDKRLLRVATGAADDLSVRARGALVVHAKKGDPGWQVLEPEKVPADAEKIRRVLDELALARATSFADAPGAQLEDALQRPELEVAVHTPSGEERVALANADGKTWVRRDGDPVLLQVNPSVATSIPTQAFDFREKHVLALASDQVHALELAFPRAGQTHRFELAGSEWKSTEPGVELKPLEVEDLLLAVAALDATGIEPAGADRKQLGLEPPVATVRAFDAKGAELGSVSLGDASPKDGIPATSSQNPDVWRVSNELGKEVPLSPEAFANLFVKKPAEAKPADAKAAPAAPPASAKP